MQKLILVILALAACALDAADYTVSTTVAREARLTRATARANRLTCGRFALPAACTQAQARKAFCTAQGAGAVTDCAGASAIDIYSSGQAWLQAVANTAIDEHGARAEKDLKDTLLAAAGTATGAQKDAACTALGLAAGCLPWPAIADSSWS